MRNITSENITSAVQATFDGAKNARFREIASALVAHLHDFAREVKLTHEEWEAAIDYLVRAGRCSDDKRNEFILTSDLLGLSSLLDIINGSQAGTESSVLGPFYIAGAPIVAVGTNLVGDNRGERVLLHGRVLDTEGKPIAGALLDFWQTNADGLYVQQDPTQSTYNLRCRMASDDEGRYALVTVKPRHYSVPYDGPGGDLLRAAERNAERPAHFHVLVTAPGHKRLVTEVFPDDDPFIDEDAVFAVRQTLVAHFERKSDASAAAPYEVEAPYCDVNFDFRLEAIEGA